MDKISRIDGKLYAKLIKGGASSLNKQIDKINALNVFPVPDGDTGTNMMYTMKGGVDVATDSNEIGVVASAVAQGMLMNARGNSGVILSQFFYGIAKGLKDKDCASIADFVTALQSGVKYAYKAVINPVEGTILTVAREGAESISTLVELDLEKLLTEFCEGLKVSLDKTPEKLKVLKEAGVVDSGGAGLVCIAQGFCNALTGVEEEINFEHETNQVVDYSMIGEPKWGYCTEFLFKLTGKAEFNLDEYINYLTSIGDSVVAFETDGMVKSHVHTKTPELAIAYAHKFGEFATLKIENMDVQHTETNVVYQEQTERVERAFVAVGSGEGLCQLYKDSGANYIVDGGQTNNPSTEDFIKAFDCVNADTIFVLPNNKNIVLAARQAQSMYEKSKVIVVDSTTPQEVYVALLMNVGDGDDEIESAMNEAIQNVQNLSLTYAVRDTSIGGIEVKKDDFIGFCDGKLVSASTDKMESIKQMLAKSDIEDKEIATVFYGADLTDDDKQQINDLFSNYKSVEVIEIEGKQQVYSLLVSLE